MLVDVFGWIPDLSALLSLGVIIDILLIAMQHIKTVRVVFDLLHGFVVVVVLFRVVDATSSPPRPFCFRSSYEEEATEHNDVIEFRKKGVDDINGACSRFGGACWCVVALRSSSFSVSLSDRLASAARNALSCSTSATIACRTSTPSSPNAAPSFWGVSSPPSGVLVSDRHHSLRSGFIGIVGITSAFRSHLFALLTLPPSVVIIGIYILASFIGALMTIQAR